MERARKGGEWWVGNCLISVNSPQYFLQKKDKGKKGRSGNEHAASSLSTLIMIERRGGGK